MASSPSKTTEPTARKASGESRRKSSGSGGMFAGMQDYKRDSEAHAARRASLKDQTAAPSGGVLANMWNSTFKGDKK